MDVQIGGYRMSEFGLRLLSVVIENPKVRKVTQSILGRNGDLDLTEAVTGYPTYQNAGHRLEFDFVDGNYDSWIARAGMIAGLIHGKRLPVVVGNSRYFYDARIGVSTEKINQMYSRLTVELDAEPYRLAVQTSLEDWLWDPFCFDTDVVREYRDIAVPGTLTIIGDPMPTGCIFHTTGSVTVSYEGIACALPVGASRVPDILITAGEHSMVFTGRGTVSVEYRGGRF